jgi:hypothetical protein
MNKNMRKWIKALRSGEYKQGCGALRPSKDKFCCLGVLCDVYRKESKQGGWVTPGDGVPMAFCATDASRPVRGGLPGLVVEWVGGLSARDEKYLSMKNDTFGEGGLSFSGIADYLEKEYK